MEFTISELSFVEATILIGNLWVNFKKEIPAIFNIVEDNVQIMMPLPSVDQTGESRPLRVNPATSAAGSPDPPGSSTDLSPSKPRVSQVIGLSGFTSTETCSPRIKCDSRRKKAPEGFTFRVARKVLWPIK